MSTTYSVDVDEPTGESLVELHPLGFVVTDNFGPEGRVIVPGDGERILVFSGRPWAESYAKLRDLSREAFYRESYSMEFQELKERAIEVAKAHGRYYALEGVVAMREP